MMLEKRFYPVDAASVEIRASEDGTSTLVGMAPPYNSWSPVYGQMRERFLAGAFDNSTEDVVATIEHDNRAVLGRVSAGTLDVDDRDDGAHYAVKLGDRSYENDLRQSVERGEIRGSSFEFFVNPDGDTWEEGEDGIWSRTVTSATRVQVGPVLRPFYEGQDVALRSQENMTESLAAWQQAHAPERRSVEWFRRRLRLAQQRAACG